MKKSTLAKNSLIFSIAGIFGFAFVNAIVESLFLGVIVGVILCIVAIVNGHKTRKEIRNSETPIEGNGMAIAGLIIGYLVMFGMINMVVMILTM